MKISFDHNAQAISIELVPSGKGYHAITEEKAIDVELIQSKDGKLDLLIDGKRVTAFVSSENVKRWVTVNGQTFEFVKRSGARRSGQKSGHHITGELTAPMPGQIRAVNVREGDAVTKGQTLLVLEAMKMEIRIHAPQDGTVNKLLVKQGQTVDREQTLLSVESQTSNL